MKRPLSVALLGFSFLIATAARADDRTEIEKGKSTFHARKYQEAEAEFNDLLNPASANALKGKEYIEDAQMYLGASQVESGKTFEAERTFEKLITLNAGYEPDPLEFSKKVRDLFITKRNDMQEAIRRQQQIVAAADAEARKKEEEFRKHQEEYVRSVEAMAIEKTIQRNNSRLVALLPFGVGHFQNREYVLGIAALSVETILFGLTVGTYFAWTGAVNEAYEVNQKLGDTPFGRILYNDLVNKRVIPFQTANLVLNLSLVGVMIVDVVLAQVRFVPEFNMVEKTRHLPPKPTATIRPTFGVWDNGGSVGLVGRF